MFLNRFSSRKQRLDKVFLADRLKKAKSYKRIAGYFRSSIFELVDEELDNISSIQIVCNSELDAADVAVARSLRDRETALKERWNQVPVEVEAVLYRDRYRKLYDLLSSGRVEIRVVPKDRVFLHGKAGIIEFHDQTKSCFIGSINETKSAFSKNYEILWEDLSEEGIAWVEEEFQELWKEGIPLPQAIIEEIKRVSERREVSFKEINTTELPAASLVESPIYRGGEQLQPWQRAFVTKFLEHREVYGKARLLLADEVGLGKTLSLAASGMVSALLDDGPILILCPSTLTLQWQTELKDHLGIPSAVWVSNRKVWQDPEGKVIKTRGAIDVVNPPYRIAIISTGLISHKKQEYIELLGRRYGTIILDEAHKARRIGALGEKKGEPNNLLKFMLEIASKTKHLLLGTATPIQTEVRELWDLLKILDTGAGFVFGEDSLWSDWERALPFIKGENDFIDQKDAWELLRKPIPPAECHQYFSILRTNLDVSNKSFFINKTFSDLKPPLDMLLMDIDSSFLIEHNPIVRHTVLRRRSTLEKRGLLEKVGVCIHPKLNGQLYLNGYLFAGLGLQTNLPFDNAYKAAEEFTKALRKRCKAAGFMKTLLLQRICSSFASGKKTAEKLLKKETLEDEEESQEVENALQNITEIEKESLEKIIKELSQPQARDPKLEAVILFLTEIRTDEQTWLEHGCIVFSQYYDTAFWIAEKLTEHLPNESIAVYAGVGKSGFFKNGIFNYVQRDEIKKAVKEREVRLVIATDAACEGLNLQTLGTLINIDLPWNPSRLEQRLGRIKRFGQARKSVDMLNLVYHETQDEKIYEVLSRRLKDQFDLFGGVPDTIDDDWIEDQQELEKKMDDYIHLREKAKKTFELKAESSIDPDQNRWELCSKVLSKKDIIGKLSKSW